MDEARRVLERLDRVEELHLAGAPVPAVLGELRALLVDAETWLAAEREAGGTAAAGRALERCRDALEGRSATVVR